MNIEQTLQLLDIQEVTTSRQKANGTRIFQLPIKMYGKYIKVGSFKSGYVRRLECIGYRSESSYQLNKRVESKPDYYKVERNGETLYRKFTTRTCELIPNEFDRLEYLVDYCLKNYYIKQANQVEDGKFVPKWRYEFDVENAEKDAAHAVEQWQKCSRAKQPNVSVIVNGQKYNII